MKGKCKWFNDKRGYGFINGEDGTDYFVHYSNIVSEGHKTLKDNEDVEFEVGKTDKGVTAQNVKRSQTGRQSFKGKEKSGPAREYKSRA